MTGWTVVLPVKRWELAKSRLHVTPSERAALARAFSLDVLEVVAATPAVARIVVVTSEDELTQVAEGLGAVVVADRPVVSGLNGAVRAGVLRARRLAPEAPTVVVPADLACLDVASLGDALARLQQHTFAAVPDASGAGTTLVAGRTPDDVVPSYGRHSAIRHARSGAVVEREVSTRCRLDVDTVQDLRQACSLGVGRRTLSRSRQGADKSPSASARAGYGGPTLES